MSSVDALRGHFPALRDRPDGPTPAYLDSACMSLVPTEVLDAMEEYYRDFPGCAGRSLHRFAEEVGHRYEASRAALGKFLGAASPESVVFLRNASEAINLVGQGLPWKAGESVLISDQEHNSNLIVWQRLVKERGIRIEVLELPPGGEFPAEAYEEALRRNVKLVSLFHTSNLDGRSLPVREIVERAHAHNARVLLDGCQAAPHVPVRLRDWGVDYYAISAHKMLGPTGTGALVGSAHSLGDLRPLLVGGETVEWSTMTDHALRPPPYRFEAGLQNYAGVLGIHAAVRFLEHAGLDAIREHDLGLNRKVTRALEDEPRVHVLGPGTPANRPSIFAFHLDGVDANDAALFLDEGYQVLVRSGMHCVHSWYRKRNLPGNVRASFYLYNDERDVDRLIDGVRELVAKIPA